MTVHLQDSEQLFCSACCVRTLAKIQFQVIIASLWVKQSYYLN